MTPVLLAVYALAVARVTGLIVNDAIFDAPRDALMVWLDDRPKTAGSFVAALIGCPWCVSIWVGAVAAPLVWFFGDSPFMIIPALMLAFSQVTGMVAGVNRG